MTVMFPEGVSFCRVHGHWIEAVDDGPDSDDNPDAVSLTGTVTLTPSVTGTGIVKVGNTGMVVRPTKPIPLVNGRVDFKVVASVDQDTNPDKWTYRVDVRFDGGGGYFFHIEAPADGEVNLIGDHSAAGPGGAWVTQGPGFTDAQIVGDALVLTKTTGETVPVGTVVGRDGANVLPTDEAIVSALSESPAVTASLGSITEAAVESARPTLDERTLYVTPRGNDASNGTTLRTAKKTIAAALTALGTTGGRVVLGVGNFPTSASHGLYSGTVIQGAGPGLSRITFSGTGPLFTTATPGARSYFQQIRDVALIGPGKTSDSIAIDISDMSNTVVENITVGGFGVGWRHTAEVVGGAVYNDVFRSVINSCTTGAEFGRAGSNGSRWRGVKFGACTTGVKIIDSNQNHFDSCQFEVCTTAIFLDATEAGLSDHNSFGYCRFEQNTVAWDIHSALVRSTEIDSPAIFASLTAVDNGTRTRVRGASGWLAPDGTQRTYRARIGSYALTGVDDVVTINAASATVTLPTAVGITGRQYTIKNLHATSLAVATTAGETIDGAAPAPLARWQTLRVMSTGDQWVVV